MELWTADYAPEALAIADSYALHVGSETGVSERMPCTKQSQQTLVTSKSLVTEFWRWAQIFGAFKNRPDMPNRPMKIFLRADLSNSKKNQQGTSKIWPPPGNDTGLTVDGH
jgi:hypothetical protein